MKDKFGSVFRVLFIIYFFSQVMSLVFFVQYCKIEDSIIMIISVDVALSELKGLLWPFLFITPIS